MVSGFAAARAAIEGLLLNARTPAMGQLLVISERCDVPIRETKSFSLAKCSTREKGASHLPVRGAEKWLAAEAKVYTSSFERRSGV
jgi:hypothetical protein